MSMPPSYKEIFPYGIIKEIAVRAMGWPGGDTLCRDGTTDFTAHEPITIVDGPGIPDVLIIRDGRYNYVVPYGNILFLTCHYRTKAGRIEFKTLFNIQSNEGWYAGQLFKIPTEKEIRDEIMQNVKDLLKEREN